MANLEEAAIPEGSASKGCQRRAWGELGNKHAVYGVWAGSNPGILALPPSGGGKLLHLQNQAEIPREERNPGDQRAHHVGTLWSPGFTV